jgi:hypothetical protein
LQYRGSVICNTNKDDILNIKYSFTGVVATEMKLLVKKRFTHKNQYQSGCDKDHLSINYFGSGLLAYIVA